MRSLPWRTAGARLHLPRDLQIAYAVGRMGLVTVPDVHCLWYGSPHTARFGFGRLLRLGLLRTFPRDNPLAPAWFSLTSHGLQWAAEEGGCEETELRAVAGIRRTNLAAVSARNRLWVSLALACRNQPTVRIGRFSPEWELRPLRTDDIPVVPDALAILAPSDETTTAENAWLLEVDAGTERSAVWTSKARSYSELRERRALYGARDWRVLATVPTAKRARTVAAAVVAGGGGAFTFVAVAGSLEEGRALDSALWSCASLVANPNALANVGLADPLGVLTPHPDQQPRSTADRGPAAATGEIPR